MVLRKMNKIIKIFNIILTSFVISFLIFFINGFIEKGIIKNEIEEFKSRGVFEEEIQYNGVIIKKYKVKPEKEYENIEKPSINIERENYYLGSKLDITITSRNPLRNSSFALASDVAGFFSKNFFIGHATINSTSSGTYYIETVGNDKEKNEVREERNIWFESEIKPGDDNNTIIGLRIKGIDGETEEKIVSKLREKIGKKYNKLLIIPLKNRYYCTDLITRTLKEEGIKINYDHFYATGNDIIVDDDTYLIYYISRISNKEFELYYLG